MVLHQQNHAFRELLAARQDTMNHEQAQHRIYLNLEIKNHTTYIFLLPSRKHHNFLLVQKHFELLENTVGNTSINVNIVQMYDLDATTGKQSDCKNETTTTKKQQPTNQTKPTTKIHLRCSKQKCGAR